MATTQPVTETVPLTMLFARSSDFPDEPTPTPRYDPVTQTADRFMAFGEGSWCSGSSSGFESFGGGDTDTYRDD